MFPFKAAETDGRYHGGRSKIGMPFMRERAQQ